MASAGQKRRERTSRNAKLRSRTVTLGEGSNNNNNSNRLNLALGWSHLNKLRVSPSVSSWRFALPSNLRLNYTLPNDRMSFPQVDIELSARAKKKTETNPLRSTFNQTSHTRFLNTQLFGTKKVSDCNSRLDRGFGNCL